MFKNKGVILADNQSGQIIAYLCGKEAASLKNKTFKLFDINSVEEYLKVRYKEANLTVYDLLSRFGKFQALYDPSMNEIIEEYKLDFRNKITEHQEELKQMPDDKLAEYAQKAIQVLSAFHMENSPATGKPPVFEIYDKIEDASMVKAFSVAGLTKWAKPEEESPLAQLNPKTPKDLPDVELVRGIKGTINAVIITEEICSRIKEVGKKCHETLREMHLADFFPGRMIEPAAIENLRQVLKSLIAQ